jgi:hypothetical protein
MPRTKEQIFAEVRNLDPEQRAELIDELLQLDEPFGLTPEQLAEVRRRTDEIDRGQAKMVPLEEALDEIRKRYQRRAVFCMTKRGRSSMMLSRDTKPSEPGLVHWK